MAKYSKKIKLENGKYEYKYQKVYKNVVKSKSGKIYTYYKPRKIKVKKQLKEIVKVAVLFCIGTQSGKTIIYETSFIGGNANHKYIKDYLSNVVEKEVEESIYRYYRAGWTKINKVDFDRSYEQKFPQDLQIIIGDEDRKYIMEANEELLNRKYEEFKENLKNLVTIHDYKNTIFVSKDYRMPSKRELKGQNKGIKSMSRKAIVRFSEKQKIEAIKKENERLKKEIEKLKKQKR